MRSVIAGAIFEALRSRALVCPKEFLHLGTRAAVDKTFSRMYRLGFLERVTRGVYRASKRTTWGSEPVTMEDVLQAVEHQCGHELLPDGEAEARALGLVPPLDVPRGKYGPLRTGRARKETVVRYGRRRKTLALHLTRVQVRSAPRWQIVLGSSRAGMATRALGWLPRADVPSALRTLYTALSMDEWDELLALRKLMPGWLAREVSIATWMR